MVRLLVTGGLGFIVADPQDVALAVEQCDAVVHLAAETHVDRSIKRPATFLRTNALGTQVLLGVIRRRPHVRLLHLSTDEVQGPCEHGAFNEDAPVCPRNPYAASKAAAEHLVISAVETYGLDASILRLSNTYGGDQHREKLIPRIVSEALAGRPVPLYGDGLQQRQWLHAADAARAVATVLHSSRPGEVLNAGGADVVTNLVLARRVLGLLGADPSRIVHVTDRPGHDRRYALDSSRIGERYGWRPTVLLSDGLAEAVRALALRESVTFSSRATRRKSSSVS